jgi:hypothetical protein
MREWILRLRILNLAQVVIFILGTLYARYPWDRRLDGPQNRCGQERTFVLQGLELRPVASRYEGLW